MLLNDHEDMYLVSLMNDKTFFKTHTMSAISCIAQGTLIALAVLSPATVVVLELARVQNIASAGQHVAQDFFCVRSDTSMHLSKRGADKDFCLAMRCALHQHRGERMTATRMLYKPSFFSLMSQFGECKRYDFPAQRPKDLDFEASDDELLKAIERYEVTGK